MAITFVSSTELVYNSATAVTSRTLTVDIGTRTNGMIGVVVSVLARTGTGTQGDVTGVTWNGVALTQAVETSDAVPFTDIWWLADPADGSHDVVVSFEGGAGAGANTLQIVVFWADSDAALELGDVNTVAAGSADPTSIDVLPDATGALCVSSYASQDNNVPTTSETLIQDYDAGGDVAGASYLIAGSATTQTLDWNRNTPGLSTIFNMAAAVFQEPGTGSSPTVTIDTANAAEFSTAEPTLLFTGSDADLDDIRYNVQIGTSPAFVSGSTLEDDYDSGTNNISIHTNPTTATSWEGNQQVDDRPGQSFTAVGGILDKIAVRLGSDEADTDGTAYVRVYAHQGVFGTSSEPLNPANPEDTPTPGWLAKSDGVPLDNTMAGQYYDFAFSGANRIRLEQGQKYVLILDWVPNGTSQPNTNTIFALASTNLGHGGNLYIDGAEPANNGVYLTADLLFKVYETHELLDKVSGTDSGFANQDNGADTDPFTSGDQIGFTVQTVDALDDGDYYFRVRGIDPADTNIYGSWATAISFTVNAVAPTTITGVGIDSLAAFGTARLDGDASPSGIASAEAIGAAQVDADLGLTGVASLEAFGTAMLIGYVSPSAIASPEVFGDVTAQGTTIFPSGAASGEAFGASRIDGETTPTGIAGGEAFGTAQLNADLQPSGIASGEAVGAQQLDGEITIGGIASLEAFGAHSISLAGGTTISPFAISSLEAFGSAQLDGRIDPAGIATGEALGDGQLDGAISISAIASLEAFGAGQVDWTITVSGIATAEDFGAQIVSAAEILAVGITSSEGFGLADVRLESVYQSLSYGSVLSPLGSGSVQSSAAGSVNGPADEGSIGL